MTALNAQWRRAGRLSSCEEIVRGGLDQFREVLPRLFRGENTGKLILGWCEHASCPPAAPCARSSDRLGPGVVAPRRPARGPGDGRRVRAVRPHRPGDRQSPDGDVRGVRQLRHAGAGLVRRHPTRQAPGPRGAGSGRQRAVDDRHGRQFLDPAGRAGHRAGHLRRVLRRDRRAERRHGRHRRAIGLRPPRRFVRHDGHGPRPAGRMVAGLGGGHRRGAGALAPARRGRASPGGLEGGRGPGRPARRGAQRNRRRGTSRRHARLEAGPARPLHRDAVSPDRSGRGRPSSGQLRRTARVVRGAERRRNPRARRPDRGVLGRSPPDLDHRRGAARRLVSALGRGRASGRGPARALPGRSCSRDR